MWEIKEVTYNGKLVSVFPNWQVQATSVAINLIIDPNILVDEVGDVLVDEFADMLISE